MSAFDSLRKKAKQILTDRCGRAYGRTYCRALATAEYGNVIEVAEAKRLKEWEKAVGEKENAICQKIPYQWGEAFSMTEILSRFTGEVLVFTQEEATLSPKALYVIGMWAVMHPEQVIFYGDEDVLTKQGKRECPWLKPEWSPALFSSVFYVGGVFAVRRKVAEKVCGDGDEKKTMREYATRMIDIAGGTRRRFVQRGETIGRIPYTLCHYHDASAYDKYLDGPEERIAAAEHRKRKITSVIIPSKDHPDVLERNIRSLVKTTLGLPLEIIVVDNGSSRENREKTERLLKELSWHKVQYIYEPMDFHFSKMCNLGASKAEGSYLLFLNDDTEALKEGWLEILCEEAGKEQTGAVGAKLLYPESDKIQHAGIVNLPMGPVHKLQFLSDNNTYYFNRNKRACNVLAVTGACLMVTKEKFWEAGGFCEELPVAFNDVDLCFSLYKKGYYNVVCNDVSLYHHESLSRGDDESFEKLTRLEAERAKLYSRHSDLAGVDPYYHPYLNHRGLDTRIVPALQEWLAADETISCVKEIPPLQIEEENGKGKLRLHRGLYVRVESVGGCFCSGYSFMSGDDNACYEKSLLLENTENKETYTCKLTGELRQDLQDNMPDQKNVAMSGFSLTLQGLPQGCYSIGIMAKNKVTGITYVNRCARRLHVSKEC